MPRPTLQPMLLLMLQETSSTMQRMLLEPNKTQLPMQDRTPELNLH
jgi:hypothetical protein